MLLWILEVGGWRLCALRDSKGLSKQEMSFGFGDAIFVYKFHYLFINPRLDLRVNSSSESVNPFGDGNKFMRNTFGREFLIHLHRQCIRHVGILGAVDQQSRWIFLRHVTHRAKWVEGLRLSIRVVATNDLGPESLLPAIQVQLAAPGFVRLFLGDQRLLA